MPGSASELIGRFHRNPVLFGAKTSDVTEPVLKRLNDEYEKRGAQPGQ
ncbi:MAG: hypothetical protein M5U26_00060 [Planctomycetota bacterium]|nr:hypothetical protein [Planctomycetota bacterium]